MSVQALFSQTTSMNYADQGKAFLNAYWDDLSGEAEKVWAWAHKFAELDLDKKAEGNDLDEFNAHRFLEQLKETKTVRQMRTEIKEADLDFNKRLALIEYCLWKYKKNINDFIRIPQGGRKEEIEEAERRLNAVTDAFDEADRRAREAKEALAAAKAAEAAATKKEAEAKEREAEAKRSEAAAKAREAEAREREKESKEKAKAAKEKEEQARAREAELKTAQDELAAALAELKAQEDAYNSKTEELKRASETGGMVSRNKAKNELAQHLGADPLPLRRAKITQEAALKKAERATAVAAEARQGAEKATAEATAAAKAASKAAQEASDAAQAATQARAAAEKAAHAATQARAEAEESRRKSEKAKQKAEEALEDARNKVAEAEAYLQEVKARIPHGSGWWMERILAEKKKYLPQRKQG